MLVNILTKLIIMLRLIMLINYNITYELTKLNKKDNTEVTVHGCSFFSIGDLKNLEIGKHQRWTLANFQKSSLINITEYKITS